VTDDQIGTVQEADSISDRPATANAARAASTLIIENQSLIRINVVDGNTVNGGERTIEAVCFQIKHQFHEDPPEQELAPQLWHHS